MFTEMQLGKIWDFKRFIVHHTELKVRAIHLQILFGHFQCITVEKPIDIHIRNMLVYSLFTGTR